VDAREDELDRLQNWYLAQCNGDWEHQNGVHIGNLDNPGWMVDINLWELPELLNRPFSSVTIERTEHDWVHAKIEEHVFKARGGPKNLREMLRIFLDWANG
jgi:hypothetical protein